MTESLVGLRVQVIVDDDGSSNPPVLPLGTIVREIMGLDRVMYYVVRLDEPVRSLNVRTKSDWILHNLAIAPNFKGGTLRPITRSSDAYVPVGMANMLVLPSHDDPILDFSKVEHFATGKVKRAVAPAVHSQIDSDLMPKPNDKEK